MFPISPGELSTLAKRLTQLSLDCLWAEKTVLVQCNLAFFLLNVKGQKLLKKHKTKETSPRNECSEELGVDGVCVHVHGLVE